jgi:hypothetical protein
MKMELITVRQNGDSDELLTFQFCAAEESH